MPFTSVEGKKETDVLFLNNYWKITLYRFFFLTYLKHVQRFITVSLLRVIPNKDSRPLFHTNVTAIFNRNLNLMKRRKITISLRLIAGTEDLGRFDLKVVPIGYKYTFAVEFRSSRYYAGTSLIVHEYIILSNEVNRWSRRSHSSLSINHSKDKPEPTGRNVYDAAWTLPHQFPFFSPVPQPQGSALSFDCKITSRHTLYRLTTYRDSVLFNFENPTKFVRNSNHDYYAYFRLQIEVRTYITRCCISQTFILFKVDGVFLQCVIKFINIQWGKLFFFGCLWWQIYVYYIFPISILNVIIIKSLGQSFI